MIDLESFLKSGALLASAKTDEIKLSWGKKTLSSDVQSFPSYYQNDFYLENKRPFVSYESNIIATKSQFCSLLQGKPLEKNWVSPDKKIFEKFFQKIKKASFKKMVPIVYEKAESNFSTANLAACLTHLLENSKQGFIYGFWDQQGGVLGLSPELLFEIKGPELKTMALAGTAPVDSSESLLDDSKEMHEHELVIEDIQKQLSLLVPNVNIEKTAEIKLSHLKHLQTKIFSTGTEEIDLVKAVEVLHPTAALGLFPRSNSWKEEMRSIRETHGSEVYGAPFGFIDKDTSEFIVCIRNLQWDSKMLYMGSGCGIVEKSDCEKEWQELSLKRQSVKKTIGIK